MAVSHRRPTVATAIRFDPVVYEALRELADDQGVPINWLVNQGMKEWMETVELPFRLTRERAAR